MKNRFVSQLLYLIWLLPGSTMAQQCLGLTIKPGTSYELTTYNAKDKPTGRMLYTFRDVRQEGASTLIDVAFQSFDEKGKAQTENTLRYTCTGNELIADLSGFMQNGQSPLGKDGEMRMKANQLSYPRVMSAGQKLKDGELEAELYSSGSKMMDMSMLMTNRQIDGQEKITTPAGTFDAYKISADLNMTTRTMGIPIKAALKTVSYRTSDLLMDVRSETYNKNGKLMAYTVLSKVL